KCILSWTQCQLFRYSSNHLAHDKVSSRLWKHKCERGVRGSEPVDSHFRPQWQRDDLRVSKQIAWPMELFGSRRGDRKNASADRFASGSDATDLALTTPVQPATKKLSVSAILFGILAGI